MRSNMCVQNLCTAFMPYDMGIGLSKKNDQAFSFERSGLDVPCNFQRLPPHFPQKQWDTYNMFL